MSDPNVPSKRTNERTGLHRSDIAGAVGWAAGGAWIIAVVLSPGGDPYSVVFFSAVIFPAAVAMYWLGFRHGKIVGQRRTEDADAQSRTEP